MLTTHQIPRAMFLRLWLLQPFLLAEIQKRTAPNAPLSAPPASVSERLEQRLRDDMSKLCVSIAQEVLDMLHGAMLGITKRTSPWHVLYCKAKAPLQRRLSG